MEKYRFKTNKKEIFVIDKIAAGVCDKTMGKTFVLFKMNLDDKFSRVMEHTEFYKKYEKSE